MRRRKLLFSIAGLVAFVLAVGVAMIAFADTDIRWRVLGGGGGTSSSTNYALMSTTGQSSAIGESSSTNYQLGAGFWYGAGCAAADLDLDGICDASDPDKDGDGCTAVQEAGLDEEFGGLRDDLNPYDFYDTNGDKVIDLFLDIFNVALAFGDDADSDPPGEPDGYDAALDRSAAVGDRWDMQAPDGLIDLFIDIFGVAFQFGHDCT